jgi:cytoskeletal protein RodZ
MQNPAPQVVYSEQPKKSNTGWIIGIVIAVLVCCCCLIAILGVIAYTGSSVSKVFSSINSQLTAMPEIPTMPSDATMEPTSPDATAEPGSSGTTAEPSSPALPGITSDTVPQGGLGTDLQRTQAWAQSLAVTLIEGCTPVAKDTKIEVLQKPDSNGMWQELWTVACESGSTVPVNITFTPSSNNITDIKVEKAK